MITLVAAAIAASSPGAQATMHAGHSQQQHGAQPQQGHQQQGHQPQGQMSAMGDCPCCKKMMTSMHSGHSAGAKPAQQGRAGH